MRSASQLIISAAGPAAAMLIVMMFAGYAVLGANGILARSGYQRQLAVRQVELVRVHEEQVRLLNRKRLLQQGDPDLADELTRGATDMVGDDEYVVTK